MDNDDIAHITSEPYAASIAWDAKFSTECLEACEAHGWARDMCSYMRNYWGSMYLNRYRAIEFLEKVTGRPYNVEKFIEAVYEECRISFLWAEICVRTVLDMGGQDCKAIRCDEKGKVISFLMNDKCAARRFRRVLYLG